MRNNIPKPTIPTKKPRKRKVNSKQEARKEAFKEILSAPDPIPAEIVVKEVVEDMIEDNFGPQDEQEIIFKPNPGPQTFFLAADEQEVLYGGAAGGMIKVSYLLPPFLVTGQNKLRELLEHS